jgi:hypothetical protein
MPKTPQQLITEAEGLAKKERDAREQLNKLRAQLRHLALSGTVTPEQKQRLLTLSRTPRSPARRNPGRTRSAG